MHCDDFAKYLERMAAKGWHFKEWGAGLKFEKGEPTQVTYAVEVFNKASENDLRPEPNFSTMILLMLFLFMLVMTEESISYYIYRSRYPRILERIWEDELDKKKNENKSDCTKDWEAEIAFRNEIGDYYVRYEDVILIFYGDREVYLDSNQIYIIRDKLELR